MADPEHCVAVLRATENDVASVLLEEDLVQFCSDLHKYRVVTKKEKQLFCSLDVDRIDSALVTRYLIQLVCGNIEKHASVWERFLRTLANGGVHRAKVHEVLEKELGNSTESSSKASDKHDVYFTEKDISCIVEVLTDISYKWEEISIALGLSTQTRRDCKGDRSNVVFLTNIITEWLNHNPAKCTLQELKGALQSETVGGSRAAIKLDKHFNRAEEACTVKSSTVCDSKLALEYQSEDEVVVCDGKATLLGVQVSPNNNTVSFQWKKNGQALSGSSLHSGVHCDTLVICGYQGVEGSYCCVITRGEEEIICDDMDVSVKYSSTKQHLLDLYSNYREVPIDSWPPIGTQTFIHPTLLKCNSQLSAASSPQQESLTYKEAFGEFDDRAVVLIRGFAGSGKTTLCHKIVKDWAAGCTLRGARLVIFIPLKFLALPSDAESLLDIINQLFYFPDEVKKQLVADIEDGNGKGICFVMDGWDGHQCVQQDNSIIRKIFCKKYLPQSMVIVTSRPATTSDLQQEACVKLELELVGFSKNNLVDYVTKLGSSSQNSLKDYILSDNHLLSMCSLPMHAAMICFIFQNKGKAPDTETSLYEFFTRLTILRHLKSKKRSTSLSSLRDLTGKDKEVFHSLCRLAFNMTISSKQVASQADLEVSFSDDDDNDDDDDDDDDDDSAFFGLVSVDHVPEIAGFRKKYCFFHSTIQEFLAAFYLLDNGHEINKVIRLAGNSLVLKVWKFYCGLNNTWGRDEYNVLNYSFLENIPDTYMFLYAVECAAESRQASVCDVIMRAAEGIALEYPLKSTHLSAIKYVLSASSEPLLTLLLCRHCTDEEGVGDILSSIKCSQLCRLSSLTLSRLSLGSEGARAVAHCLSHCEMLRELNLSHNCLHSEDIAGLVKNSYCLTKVILSHNHIRGDVASSVKKWKSLEELDLSYNEISLDDVISLVSSFKDGLETFYLQGNSGVSFETVLTLAEELNDLSSHRMRNLHLDVDGVAQHQKEYSNVVIKFCQKKNITRRSSYSTYETSEEIRSFSSSFLMKLSERIRFKSTPYCLLPAVMLIPRSVMSISAYFT